MIVKTLMLDYCIVQLVVRSSSIQKIQGLLCYLLLQIPALHTTKLDMESIIDPHNTEHNNF